MPLMRDYMIAPKDDYSTLNPSDALSANGARKPMLTNERAGLQISRGDFTWNGVKVIGKPVALTYYFYTKPPKHMSSFKIGGFKAFSRGQKLAVKKSLESWSDVANISFKEVPSSAQANLKLGQFTYSSEGAFAFSVFPPTFKGPGRGDSWYNGSTQQIASQYGLNGYGRLTFTHELGHSLGLSHPSDYNAGQRGPLTYKSAAQYAQDTRGFSIMSYFSEHETRQDFKGQYAAGPMLHDIMAIQHLYGPNTDTRKGDTTYGFHSNTGRDFLSAKKASDALIFVAWDAGGKNTFDFSGYAQKQKIDLHQMAFSNVGGLKGNVAIAKGTHIQHAIGGKGNDLLIGNDDRNILEGKGGNNFFYGGRGGDTLVGGPGKNTFYYSRPSDSSVKSPDKIMGFKKGKDVIDLSGLVGSYHPAIKYSKCAKPAASKIKVSIKHQDAQHHDLNIMLNGHTHPDMKIKITGDISMSDVITTPHKHNVDIV